MGWPSLVADRMPSAATTDGGVMRQLIRVSILVLLCGVLATPIVGETEAINTLKVVKGPGVEEVTLTWGGDFAPYAVYRSTLAFGVVAPANLQAHTASNGYVDPTAFGSIYFFNVIGACTSS